MYMSHERQQYLLRALEQRGRLRSAEMARELGVTEETIRTDLVRLQNKGLLKRVRGGAVYILPAATDPDSPRLDVQLARQVAMQIEAGMTLMVDSTPFACILAMQLANRPCTIITNSPRLLKQLSPAALPHRLFCPGGFLDKKTGLLAPTAAMEKALQDRRPHAAILSPPALAPARLFYHSKTQAHWAMLSSACASRRLVAVGSAALRASAPFPVECTPDLLVTEDNCPSAFDSVAKQTVPYVSPDSLVRQQGFDY